MVSSCVVVGRGYMYGSKCAGWKMYMYQLRQSLTPRISCPRYRYDASLIA